MNSKMLPSRTKSLICSEEIPFYKETVLYWDFIQDQSLRMDTKRLCESSIITAVQTPIKPCTHVVRSCWYLSDVRPWFSDVRSHRAVLGKPVGPGWLWVHLTRSSSPLPGGGSVSIEYVSMQLLYAQTPAYPELPPKSLKTRLEHHCICQTL